ncbi:MAG: M23 family metallopeptidase [Thermoleophilia bacterium]|nr:M23 family metallopeptidase [Thermoleophilia bacterium]
MGQLRRAGIRTASASFLLAILALVTFVMTPMAANARPDSKAVISPLAFRVLERPSPVRGADNRMHLAYELQVVNQSPLDVTIKKIGIRGGKNLLGKAMTETDIAGRINNFGGGTGATVLAGSNSMIIVDATYSRSRKTPKRISHGVVLSWTDPTTSELKKLRFAGVRSRVGQRKAVRVDAPLRGGKWVGANGCCVLNPHRGATLSIDGTIRVPERFAIDYVQLNDDDRLFSGPLNENSSYPYFGDPIYSVAKGKVVRVRDGLPEQTPGSLPTNATLQMAGGNHVVVNIGHGRFAFYAHLQPGSITVKKGQRIKSGRVIGKLGNTGNTDGAHLHFHIMDSASPLQSNGLPFVFRKFRGQGFITDEAALQAGGDPGIKRRLIGPHRNQLPLANQIVSFGRRNGNGGVTP